jgi:hypothetical protein
MTWPTDETIEALRHSCNIEGEADPAMVRDALLADPVLKTAVAYIKFGGKVEDFERLRHAVYEAGL